MNRCLLRPHLESSHPFIPAASCLRHSSIHISAHVDAGISSWSTWMRTVWDLFPWLQCRSKRNAPSGRSSTWETCWRPAIFRASGYDTQTHRRRHTLVFVARRHFSSGLTMAVIPPNVKPFSSLAKAFTCHHFLLTDKPGGEPRAHWWHHWLRGLCSQVWVSCCESGQWTQCPLCKTSMSSLVELGSSKEAHTPMSGCWVKEMEIGLNTG